MLDPTCFTADLDPKSRSLLLGHEAPCILPKQFPGKPDFLLRLASDGSQKQEQEDSQRLDVQVGIFILPDFANFYFCCSSSTSRVLSRPMLIDFDAVARRLHPCVTTDFYPTTC